MTYAIQIIACNLFAFGGMTTAGVGGLLVERGEDKAACVFCMMSAILITLAILVRP